MSTTFMAHCQNLQAAHTQVGCRMMVQAAIHLNDLFMNVLFQSIVSILNLKNQKD